ncbi:SDR family NAD(P)-dependent oxidoreductase [Smaragdicoccus niigatensis]|uniref:SDR family NAD(P)-dependent oxidoreductase n=1 Tax=Smaragdicoccus niigatensis TaxID=359359 RepID=UPI0003A9B865|nr:SDR family oxidoreductase [Smaragdicoccus niigatensis]
MRFDGKTAMITGASSGIGAAFADALASRGADLVLVARRQDRLQEAADHLTGKYGVQARIIPADLANPEAVAALTEHVAGIDILINNAGFATHGAFGQNDPARMDREIAVNVGAVVQLTQAALSSMVEKNDGLIVNIASTAAFQPIPYMAVYGATKAFVLSFTEALWGELEGTNVRVMALCPGATATEFFDVAGESASVGKKQTPEQVVATAFRAIEHSTQPSVVSGVVNTLSASIPRFLPRRTVIRITRQLVAPK